MLLIEEEKINKEAGVGCQEGEKMQNKCDIFPVFKRPQRHFPLRFGNVKVGRQKQKKSGAVVVAQWAEQLLTTPQARSSNLAIGKFLL